MPPSGGRPLRGWLRLRWPFVLVVVAVDLWWSGTPLTFEIWWIPVILANVIALGLVLWPMIRGTP